MDDPTVQSLISKYVSRSDKGMIKYGMSMRDNPLELLAWLNHLQEELMDASLYIERAMEEIRKG